MKVKLINYTKGGIELVAKSARVSGVPSGLKNNEIVRMIVENDYSSALEHISFTFEISGISLALSRELLEHRITSHTGRSTRYNEEDGFGYYTPKDLARNSEALKIFDKAMKDANKCYLELKKLGMKKEGRRYVLPLAAHCSYVWTANARSLINFLSLRLCVRAAPEIKELAEEIKKVAVKLYPEIFAGIGCRGITFGVCPENEVRKFFPTCPYTKGKKRIPTKQEIKEKWGKI